MCSVVRVLGVVFCFNCFCVVLLGSIVVIENMMIDIVSNDSSVSVMCCISSLRMI